MFPNGVRSSMHKLNKFTKKRKRKVEKGEVDKVIQVWLSTWTLGETDRQADRRGRHGMWLLCGPLWYGAAS